MKPIRVLAVIATNITWVIIVSSSSVLGYVPVSAFPFKRLSRWTQKDNVADHNQKFPWSKQRSLHDTARNSRRTPFRQWTTTSLQASSKPSSSTTAVVGSIISAAVFVVLDVACRRGFLHFGIAFPSSLGGCGLLFALLLLLSPFTQILVKILQPGANLLAKWLPVFFVPSLVTLPLFSTQTLGISTRPELFKLIAVVVGGFLGSLYSTALAVLCMRKLTEKPNRDAPRAKNPVYSGFAKVAIAASTIASGGDESSKTPAAPKAFSNTTAYGLYLLTLLSGAATYLSTMTASKTLPGLMVQLAAHLGPHQRAWCQATCLLGTLGSFVWGARLPKRLTKVVHPVVTCTALTWVICRFWGQELLKIPFTKVLQGYTVGGGLSTMCGAGDVLLFLLGPAVVSLAVSMYNRRKLMWENAASVVAGVTVATFGGLFGTAWAVQALNLGSKILRQSLLSRNITSPLAMAITNICGGNASLAVSLVVVTGLLGANFGATLLTAVGFKNPIDRGLSMGAAAHGLGTASLAADEEQAFAFSAISMALTASAATVAVSVPGIRQALLQIALRGTKAAASAV